MSMRKETPRFRDIWLFGIFLRLHSEVAHQYGSLKLELATRFPDGNGACVMGKDELARSIEQQAVAWANQFQDNQGKI